MFDFDEQIDRRAVPALKTHARVLGVGGEELFAAGVADMDFKVAPPISQALQKRLAHGIFGYEAVPNELFPALRNWMFRRHQWDLNEDHILRAPNALNALAIAASLFSDEGDGIIIQPPVFFDFFDIIEENHRACVENPLLMADGRYTMDFDGLDRLAAEPRNKILFLCNPHNPVGRVWTEHELLTVAEICQRNEILVVSDELHGDITFEGHQFTPFASLSENAAEICISILSPAKSFNIASCCSAFVTINDDARRAAFQAENSRLTVNKNNAFSNVAMLAAYSEGEDWLDALRAYLAQNLSLVRNRLFDCPTVELTEPEGTFLLWLDFRGLNLTPDALHLFLREKARWAVTRGTSFGQQGAGFARLNIACPSAVLDAALVDLKRALGRIP